MVHDIVAPGVYLPVPLTGFHVPVKYINRAIEIYINQIYREYYIITLHSRTEREATQIFSD